MVNELQAHQFTYELDLELMKTFEFEGMIGRSPLMLDLFRIIKRIAPHSRTVLVTGPTGTGKELVGKALHQLNPNATGTFCGLQ